MLYVETTIRCGTPSDPSRGHFRRNRPIVAPNMVAICQEKLPKISGKIACLDLN